MARRKIGTLYYDTNLEEGFIKITGDPLFYGIVALDTISDWIVQLEELYDKELQRFPEVYKESIEKLKAEESARGTTN
jgi:uncharacterized membrane protein YoaT (DUF817 family)